MKAYLAATAALFILLTGAHLLRVMQEPHLARDPWFIVATVVAVAMAAWAVQLLISTRRAHDSRS